MKNGKVIVSAIDYWSENPDNCFLFKMLDDDVRSRIEINQPDPDIVITFGYSLDFINYESAVKIKTLSNEACLYPNDVYFDYYIGAVNNSLDDTDRSCYIPWWFEEWFRAIDEKNDFSAYREKDFLNRKFCSQVGRLANRPHRADFINALTKNGKSVEYLANSSYVGLSLPGDSIQTQLTSKLNFITNYKFNLTFENTDKIGYITEKSVDPFFACTVPVYFGNNPTFYRDFNYDDGLMLNGKTYQEVIDYMLYLDSHDDAYLAVIDNYFNLGNFKRKVEEYSRKFSKFMFRIVDGIR